MSLEVHGLPGFYASPPGIVAARRVRERLLRRWPDLTGRDVLGIGWTGPYLGLWRSQAYRCISLLPAQLAHEPARDAHPVVSAEDEALPFPDRSFDRVLLVHGLETAENSRRLLREVWRVLADEGRVLVVAPNRRGIWAHLEATPFGNGQPYTMGQLSRLLTRALFVVEAQDTALFIPPFTPRPLLRGARAWDSVGRVLLPRFAGVVMVEARKAVWGALPAGGVPATGRRVMISEGT